MPLLQAPGEGGAGVEAALQLGPDRWQLAADGATLVDTTFANMPGFAQAYPDNYPAGNHPTQSGALVVNGLGYLAGEFPMDAVYQITRSFDHSGESLTLDFTALGLQWLGDESWGLDNVRV